MASAEPVAGSAAPSSGASSSSSDPIPPLPSDCRLLYVSGDQSGVGKSSIVVALLHLLTTRLHVPPAQLAYIKPATQCRDVTATAKYCHHHRIEHVDLGPVIFYAGYTQHVLDHTAPDTLPQRRHAIRAAVHRLAQGRRYVLVDGVGYPAVGGVCGVSNAAVARLLGAPVLLVSRPGIGNAIDATLYMQAFFLYHGAAVLGVLFNKLPTDQQPAHGALTTHTYDRAKHYTALFFATHTPRLAVYGHVPILAPTEISQAWRPAAPSEGSAGAEAQEQAECMVRGGKEGWKWGFGEEKRMQEWLTLAEQHIDIDQLVADIERFYASPAQPLPATTTPSTDS